MREEVEALDGTVERRCVGCGDLYPYTAEHYPSEFRQVVGNLCRGCKHLQREEKRVSGDIRDRRTKDTWKSATSSMEALEAYYRGNFNKLVKRYKRPLGSEQAAEDVVQESFCRAIKYIDRWDSTQLFEPWFVIILRNAFRDKLNEDRGIVFEEIDEFDFPSKIDTRDYQELREAIEHQISKEREDKQEILNLFFFVGYTGQEISEMTDFKPGAIRKTVHDFKRKFFKEHPRQ